MADQSRFQPSADALEAAYADCQAIARSTARNFYYAFLILPKPQRQAMCALYAFMRQIDDIGDGDAWAPDDDGARGTETPASSPDRKQRLDDWRKQLDDTLAGREPAQRWWLALADSVERFAIEPAYLHDAIDGVASDLGSVRFQTFDELYRYCFRVASAVGLACVRIWGARDPRADVPAEHCGIAFQLTNIIRDVAEDRARGRIYLPIDDLDRFGIDADHLFDPATRQQFIAMLRFQIARAHGYYDRAAALRDYLPPSGRAAFRGLVDIYRGLLRKIERRPEAVFDSRVALHPMRKMAFLAGAWPERFFSLPRSPILEPVA